MEAIFNSAESEPPNLVNSNIGSLLFKLVKIGVGKQLHNIVKQQLSKTKTAFKFEK